MITHKAFKDSTYCGSIQGEIHKHFKKCDCYACFQEALKDRSKTSYHTAKRWYEIKEERGEIRFSCYEEFLGYTLSKELGRKYDIKPIHWKEGKIYSIEKEALNCLKSIIEKGEYK